MKKTIKYWLFYISEEYVNEFDYLLRVKYDDDQNMCGYYNLYAYTDDPSYMKLFIKTRDMKKFTMKEELLDTDGIHHLAEYFRYGYLGKYKIETSTNKRLTEVSILCTSGEYRMIMMYPTFYISNPQKLLPNYVPVEIFKKEYRRLFEITGITYITKILCGDIPISVNDCPFTVDLLHIFIDLFGKLMKG